ncbi:hypothetical protein QBC47DRAFT_409646 [Echria macrotheca]|uniref:Uncharacterized protein n=1 Tax=Echria macrotheca TaxID=438768 RepID=A0AAJ0BIY8_9PEZI|nr:hypothetical protein QBC47DRAFT_409646 [Echria macrotheca]
MKSALSLVFSLSFAVNVLGGSRAWEGSISNDLLRMRHEAQETPIAVDAAGYALRMTDNATHTGLKKRYFSVNPGAGRNPTYLWPKTTISYCFDTQESKDKIYEYLELAIDSWRAAGLSPYVYKYAEVANPGTACTQNKQRDAILVISHNDLGRHQTTVGMWPIDKDTRPDYVGPTMELSTRDDVAHLNIVANIAHEIGHAWGLYHEHQNPLFWGAPYYNEANPDLAGRVFGTNFDCSALRDYHPVRQKIQAKYRDNDALAVQTMRDVCTKASAASDWGFSAADWLPIVANFKHTPGIPSMGANYQHVDWDSIMLYASGAGGLGSARPPTNPSEDPDVYDMRAPVLRRNDGAKIRPNAVPSAGDVTGIRKLYDESASYREGNNLGRGFQLINDPKSNRFVDFIKDITGKKGGPSCEN